MPTTVMPIFTFTTDPIVKRLRWAMLGIMLFSVINTLSGQPESFWHHPETAIRGDGLSIYNETNSTFNFFLGYGWLPYLITSLIYLSVALLLVSILSRKIALVAMFSIIFGHYFGATNWLAVRWHLGINSSNIYGLVVAPVIVFSAFPTISSNSDQIIKRIRWVMLVPMLLDMINTLIGQPPSYWLHSETVHEANEISRFFLIHGWYAYVLWSVFYFSGIFWLVLILQRRLAFISIFYFTLGHFVGASNWFFYEWRMGMETPVIFGVVLSILITLVAFQTHDKTTAQNLLSNEVAA